MRTSAVFMVGILGLGLAACDAGEPLSAPPPGLLVADVTASPGEALPGDLIAVTVRVPWAPALKASVRWRGQPSVNCAFVADGAHLVARVELRGPDAPGDALIEVRGTWQEGRVEGYRLVRLGDARCPAGETRVDGACVAQDLSGHAMAIERFMPWLFLGLNDDGEIRNQRSMNHPRAIARKGRELFVCASDAVSLVDMTDLMLPEDFRITADYAPAVAETRMSTTGLSVCQDVAVNWERRVGIASSRGDSAGPGGLSVWHLPEDGTAPVLRMVHPDDGGFEEVLVDGDTVYATASPNRVVIFRLLHDDGIQVIHDAPLPGAATVWGLAKGEDDRLYVTDVGNEHDHGGGTIHLHQGGQLFVLDVAEPYNPVVLGSTQTGGPSKGVAILPDGVVATGSGAAGVELFDVSLPGHPRLLSRFPVHGSVVGISYDEGYLAASTWEGVRLYDATVRGTLRLMDTADELESPLGPLPAPFAQVMRRKMLTTYFVLVTGRDILIAEFSNMYYARIYPERTAPRLNVHERKLVLKAGGGVSTHLVRVSNGGTLPVEVAVAPAPHVAHPGERLLLAPGEMDYIEVQIAGLSGPADLTLESTDPANPARAVPLVPRAESYAAGDPLPTFELPAIAPCAGEPHCPPDGACINSEEVLKEGRPVVLAFFSSW